MNTIADYERFIIEKHKEIAAEVAAHKRKIEALKWEITNSQEEINRQLAGLDSSIILHAEHILDVEGSYERAGEDRVLCLESVIHEILDGGRVLFSEYYGTKNYDRWRGQFIHCTYGMAPSHGSVCFSIGLQRVFRRSRDEDRKLTEDEINACVYYLRNLVAIQKAAEESKEVVA